MYILSAVVWIISSSFYSQQERSVALKSLTLVPGGLPTKMTGVLVVPFWGENLSIGTA